MINQRRRAHSSSESSSSSILSRCFSSLKRLRSREKRENVWKWRGKINGEESADQSLLLGCSIDGKRGESSSSISEESTGSSEMVQSSGRYTKDVFNLGVGVGMLFLIAASKNEYNKMMELRRQMEMLLNDVKDKLQRDDVIFKPSQSKNYISNSTTNLQEVASTSYHIAIQTDALPHQLVDAETSMECGQSSKCYMPRREECLAGMDQLEAELEAELEHLQLHLDNEDSLEQQIEEVHKLLEERQQQQITELKLALECTKHKLLEKEMEVSRWKDTVQLISQNVPEAMCLPCTLKIVYSSKTLRSVMGFRLSLFGVSVIEAKLRKAHIDGYGVGFSHR
ncbi:hypothetical protein HHK36_013825 [Tetracentron sinense]|uniref:Uncharacterized protein n=1 Tax=Tetracentron sinense TaxID=13715 RepID=A0A834Z7R8_TETSI|nr:hypothetical protein HHK36_013825 [Tetracentron sinense]